MTMFYAGTPITCIWCDKSRYMTSLLCWWLSRRSESGFCLIFCDKYARVTSKLSDGVCCWQDKVGVIQRRYLIAARLQQWLLNLSDVRN